MAVVAVASPSVDVCVASEVVSASLAEVDGAASAGEVSDPEAVSVVGVSLEVDSVAEESRLCSRSL